jgi:hypothetical protein
VGFIYLDFDIPRGLPLRLGPLFGPPLESLTTTPPCATKSVMSDRGPGIYHGSPFARNRPAARSVAFRASGRPRRLDAPIGVRSGVPPRSGPPIGLGPEVA